MVESFLSYKMNSKNCEPSQKYLCRFQLLFYWVIFNLPHHLGYS
jgi:hypothetical protein